MLQNACDHLSCSSSNAQCVPGFVPRFRYLPDAVPMSMQTPAVFGSINNFQLKRRTDMTTDKLANAGTQMIG